MIKKLRRKFVLMNMSLVSAVLVAVFCFVLVSDGSQSRRQADEALNISLENAEKTHNLPMLDAGGHRGAGPSAVLPAFVVTLDAKGAILSVQGQNAQVSDSAVEEAVQAVLSRDETQGKLSALKLWFRTQQSQTTGERRVAFVDMSSQLQHQRQLVLTLLLVLLGALGAFFAVSLFLSAWALRPVEKAWEQQRQFVADASHELKTPLTVILANTGILLAHPEASVASQRRWVENTGEEAQRMKQLVNDMLFLAKSDSAKAPAPHEKLDFSELVMGCALPFEAVAFERGVTLENQVAPDISLLGNGAQLRQLTAILLDNACKYASRGGCVRLTLERQKERAVLTVLNTGEPIPPEHLPHLFERFYRADASRAREVGGYGLGLSIAKTVTDAHHGKIWVESQNDGTVFSVALPLRGC